MRLAQFLFAVAALTVAAHRADAHAPAAPPWTISVAWPAPVGHFQPALPSRPRGRSRKLWTARSTTSSRSAAAVKRGFTALVFVKKGVQRRAHESV